MTCYYCRPDWPCPDHLMAEPSSAPSPTDEERATDDGVDFGCRGCGADNWRARESHAKALARARSEGRREGIEEAARWCADQSAFGVMFAEVIRALADEGKDGG